MIFGKLFRRHYAITALILFGCLAIGHLVNIAMMRVHKREEIARHPPLFFAKMIDLVDPKDRGSALEKMHAAEDDNFPFRLSLLAADGAVLYPKGLEVPEEVRKTPFPTEVYVAKTIERLDERGPGFGRPTLIRLPGEPAQFLYMDMLHGPPPGDGPRRGPPGGGMPPPPGLFGPSALVLLLSLLIGSAVSVLLILRYVQSKVRDADRVIAELRSGNLKARIPVRRQDEVGDAMSRFNAMADEIERLFEELRNSERARMSLLQELAHDLRTPIASLKNLLETLSANAQGAPDAELTPELRNELFELTLKETAYFERLVEDLLTLAQVGEPAYRPADAGVNFSDLIEEEVESCWAAHRGEKKIDFVREITADLRVQGDPNLLRRMVRNVLENAASFAKSKVRIVVGENEGRVRFSVQDDGPGMPKEILASYGERRHTRLLPDKKDGRISIGLGAVTVKTVARVHRGTVIATNANTASDAKALGGAGVTIHLPLSIGQAIVEQ